MDHTFSAGRIINNGFGIAAKYAHVLLPLTVLISLPSIIYTVWLANNLTVSNMETYDIAYGFVGLPLGSLLSAVLIHFTMIALKRDPMKLGTSVRAGVSRWIPVLLTSLAVVLCILVGTVLLIVPGLIAMVLLFVALPVTVIEAAGVKESISRSVKLTEGYRWQIFGIAMLSGGLAIVAGIVLYELAMAGELAVETMLYLSVAIEVAVSILTAVFSAATYYELRRAKEGIELPDLVKAFD